MRKPKQLTEDGVAKLKPPEEGQIDQFDSLVPGLILRLGYGGAKTWLVRHYRKGRNKHDKKISIPTTHKLGRYPILKVKQAREKAREFLADPQRALARADTGSFGEVAATFLKRHVKASNLRTEHEIERILNKYVLPNWKDRPFRDLKRSDVIPLLDGVADDHGTRQADMVLAIVRKIMNWYASRNDDYASPIVRGMGRYNAKDHRPKRVLDNDEIRALWTGGEWFRFKPEPAGREHHWHQSSVGRLGRQAPAIIERNGAGPRTRNHLVEPGKPEQRRFAQADASCGALAQHRAFRRGSALPRSGPRRSALCSCFRTVCFPANTRAWRRSPQRNVSRRCLQYRNPSRISGACVLVGQARH
jgi:hypothetical protein